jgi:hypothetical protein
MYSDFIWLEPHVQWEDATAAEVEEAKAALAQAAGLRPNYPTLRSALVLTLFFSRLDRGSCFLSMSIWFSNNTRTYKRGLAASTMI